jgi:hypothetical protein
VIRVLGLDWDHGRLRLVEASVQGGKVSVQHAHSWPETVTPNPVQAEEAGARLRERMKEAGIGAAPVLACLGRDRVIVRDIRYPDVPPEEVPDIIRFQAAKELTFPADETIIDFSLINSPLPSGEKRALAVILRKELLAAYQTMCTSAGLRLEGLTVRPFALLANWQTSAAANGWHDAEAQALLVGSELCVTRGNELLFARTVPGAGALARPSEEDCLPQIDEAPKICRAEEVLPELRRSFAAFSGQFPKHPIRTLYIGDADMNDGADGLAAKLRLPVRSFEAAPAGLLNGHAEEAGGFAAALGLVQSAGARRKLTVDFVHPKQAPVASSNKKRRAILIAAAAAAPLLALGLWYAVVVGLKNSDIEALQNRKAELQKRINDFGDVDKRYEAVAGWADGEMVIVDELYDFIAHFPDVPGIRITSLTWTAYQPESAQQNRGASAAKPPTPKKEKTPIGQFGFVAEGESTELLERLHKELQQANDHWLLEPGAWEKDQPTPRHARATIKVFHIEPKDYKAVLGPHSNVTKTDDGQRRPDGFRAGGGGRPMMFVRPGGGQ